MNPFSAILGVVAALTPAQVLPALAADPGRELTAEDRDALALGSTGGPRLYPMGTQIPHETLAGFNFERLRLAPVAEITRLVLSLLAAQQIEAALAMILSLPTTSAAEVLASVTDPARLAELSPLNVESLAQMLATNGSLLSALTEKSPESVAALLSISSEEASEALLATITNSDQIPTPSVATLLRLADAVTALADLKVRSDFDAEHLSLSLAIKRISPGFMDLSPETPFGVRLRELKAEAKANGETPELKARIAALYREALDAVSAMQRKSAKPKHGP